jgi:imidazolonepropionase-like amidohydrolase
MTPRQALEAATIRPAEFFSMDDKGQIKVGMEADLVLLEKNPLENIRHTRTIVNVIANGEVVR